MGKSKREKERNVDGRAGEWSGSSGDIVNGNKYKNLFGQETQKKPDKGSD